MKHTYLYPLPEKSLFLWRAGRAYTSDLFGDPEGDSEEWLLLVTLDEQLGQAREALAHRIKDTARVCLGRSYVIPGSVRPDDKEFGREIHPSTREITRLLWDAPHLDAILRTLVVSALGLPEADVSGRDPFDEIVRFLQAHEGHRLVPVWM